MATRGLADRPWLLLPGTLCTSAVFDGFLDALDVGSANRHCVDLQWPAIDDYRVIFEDLPEDTIVCGFSLGAIVAAHFADRMAARYLVLFGLNPYADDPAKTVSRHDLAADVTGLGGAAALRARAIEVVGPSPDETRAMIYDMAEASANHIDAQTRLALTRPGAMPALSRAQLPVITLTGALDRSAPPAQGRSAAQSAPDGQFRELPGLGHFALAEDPAACAAAFSYLLETRHDPA